MRYQGVFTERYSVLLHSTGTGGYRMSLTDQWLKGAAEHNRGNMIQLADVLENRLRNYRRFSSQGVGIESAFMKFMEGRGFYVVKE